MLEKNSMKSNDTSRKEIKECGKDNRYTFLPFIKH